MFATQAGKHTFDPQYPFKKPYYPSAAGCQSGGWGPQVDIWGLLAQRPSHLNEFQAWWHALIVLVLGKERQGTAYILTGQSDKPKNIDTHDLVRDFATNKQTLEGT